MSLFVWGNNAVSRGCFNRARAAGRLYMDSPCSQYTLNPGQQETVRGRRTSITLRLRDLMVNTSQMGVMSMCVLG